jgi:hypothetical protein
MVPRRRSRMLAITAFDAAKAAEKIRLHDSAKLIEWGFFDGAAAGDAGVVDQNIDSAVLGRGFGERLPHRCVVVNVESGQMNRELFVRYYFADLRTAAQISHCSNDDMARSRQRDGGRQSDAAARSSDQSRGHVASPFVRDGKFAQ